MLDGLRDTKPSWVWLSSSLLVLLALVLTSVRLLLGMEGYWSLDTTALLVGCLTVTIAMTFQIQEDVKPPSMPKLTQFLMQLDMALALMALSYTLLLHLVWHALN